MEQSPQTIDSKALKVNLERTAVTVEIPASQAILLTIADKHFGVLSRVRELLLELNHPYVNWAFVLKELRAVSIGDFYVFNSHANGLDGLRVFLVIYTEIISRAGDEDVRETAIRYLFDFINTIIGNSGDTTERNMGLFCTLGDDLFAQASKDPLLFKKASGYSRNLTHFLSEHRADITGDSFVRFLFLVFRATYSFWLTQPDPSLWFQEKGKKDEAYATYGEIVGPLCHRYLSELLARLEQLDSHLTLDEALIGAYDDLPDFGQISNGYLLTADTLESAPVFGGYEHLVKLDFLFNMMRVPGLSDLSTVTLREINRCLRLVFREEQPERLQDFLVSLFSLLKRSASRYKDRGAIIDCITTIAREVFVLNNHFLVNTLIEEMIKFGFEQPKVGGTTAEWQVQVNPHHVMNIRAWLEIIALKPRWTKRLLSALIVNLKLGGIFIRDTDLVQRDISALLNSDITPAYNLVKQLLRIFPVYFKEIGAEGELRDISTKVDELSFRNDKLIHFLRKQSHVESNSLLVYFIEDVFRFWRTGDKDFLRRHLPDEVFRDVSNKGEYFDEMYTLFQILGSETHDDFPGLLSWDRQRIIKALARAGNTGERDRERAGLMIRLYQLLHKKYFPDHTDLLKDLEASGIFSYQRIKALKKNLKTRNHYAALTILLEFLSLLRERILSPVKTTPFENIYYKRHIAAGIPSMYGTYQEEKFDALALVLRLESLATTLFEELITSLNLKFITKSALIHIYRCLWLYVRALELEGISTEGLTTKMKYIGSALQLRQFSVDQYVDIFKFIGKGIQDIIHDYYIDVHRSNLAIVVGQMIEGPGGQDRTGNEEAVYQLSENLFRSIISSAFGLQVLDTFTNSIMGTLAAESERFKNNKEILNLVMNYNPELAISPIYRKKPKTDNQILIGNKGYLLKELASIGFPVPRGFIITTEVFRGYEAVKNYKYISKDLSARIHDEIVALEKSTGKRFGDPDNPLLLSVRSGATVSLPGMMSSFLNVGINEEIAEGLSKSAGYEWAAWDCYRRFIQAWGMFQGLKRDIFDNIMDSFKKQYDISRKVHFAPGQMKEIALTYKRAIEEQGIEIPDDPPLQIQDVILRVFASWYSDQAKTYRRHMHLSDEWGTAVIVQEMIFGNLNDRSGSGVIFTRDPKGSSAGVTLYGDFIFGVQGDDIVSGLVETYPISENQRFVERPDITFSLETRFPDIYKELQRLSEHLVYEKGFNHQEIEFTFEDPTKNGLYVLQTRDMAQINTKKLKMLRETDALRKSFVGAGIGVSGGALCGRAVYSEDDINYLRTSEPDTPLILIRPDTVPDDVGILLQVEGILTARGGATSHAAVTIPQLDKVGVVGFNKLRVYEKEGYSAVDTHTIQKGEFICIDGWSGMVYLGFHEYEPEEALAFSL